MAAAWRVAHRMFVWGDLLSFVLFLTLLAALATVVPVGLVVEERHELMRTAHQLQASVGGPEVVFEVLAWLVVALLAIPWGLLVRRLWRAAGEQYRDLFGAERFVEGPIERLESRGRGSRLRFLAHVQGEGFSVSGLAFRALRVGQPVRLRVTRFNALVKDVSVPAP